MSQNNGEQMKNQQRFPNGDLKKRCPLNKNDKTRLKISYHSCEV